MINVCDVDEFVDFVGSRGELVVMERKKGLLKVWFVVLF